MPDTMQPANQCLCRCWKNSNDHALSHLQPVFAGARYAAGNDVYMGAEVLSADGFEAFAEAGNPFDTATARRLLRSIYSSGHTQNPADAFCAFRGRGLLAAAAA